MIRKSTAIILFLATVSFVFPLFAGAQAEPAKARIVDVVSTKEVAVEGLGITSVEQVVTVFFIDGPHSGSQKTFVQDKFQVEEGETVFVQESSEGQFQLVEKDRTQMIAYIVALFVALVLLLNGRQGIRSLVGLAGSLVVIVFVMLPLVIRGVNPLLVSISVGAAILATVIFLSHGYNKGSYIALAGTMGAILCAGLLSLAVSYWMRLTGLGSDEALSATVVTGGIIDFSELLLAGIIVGMLGVLDDIAVTQVAVVGEIKRANALLPVREVFGRALRVGKEHVSALVNTLVLAYTGASFPLLILLYSSGVRLDMLVSQEIVAAEIVRTLVGSIGLIIAVPLTTYLAARYLTNEDHVHSTHHGHPH
jgi:uncharacterized membrane protein